MPPKPKPKSKSKTPSTTRKKLPKIQTLIAGVNFGVTSVRRPVTSPSTATPRQGKLSAFGFAKKKDVAVAKEVEDKEEMVVQETQFAGLTQSPGFESSDYDDVDEMGAGLKPRFKRFAKRRGSRMEVRKEAMPPLTRGTTPPPPPIHVVREAQLGVGGRGKNRTIETPPMVRKRKAAIETQDHTPSPPARRRRDIAPPPIPHDRDLMPPLPVTPKRPASRKFPDEIPCSQSPVLSPLKTQVSPGRFNTQVSPVKAKIAGARTVVRSSQWYENEDTQGALDSGEGEDSSPLSPLPDTTPGPLAFDKQKQKHKSSPLPRTSTTYTNFSPQIQTPATPPPVLPRAPPATRTPSGIVHETPPHHLAPQRSAGRRKATSSDTSPLSSQAFFSQTQSQTQGPHRDPFRSPVKARSPTKTATTRFSTAGETPSLLMSNPVKHHTPPPPNQDVEDEDFDLDLVEDSQPIRYPATASLTASLHSSAHSEEEDEDEDLLQSFHPVRTQQFSESMYVRKFNEEESERREARKDREMEDITTSQLLPDTLMETFPLPSSWVGETQ